MAIVTITFSEPDEENSSWYVSDSHPTGVFDGVEYASKEAAMLELDARTAYFRAYGFAVLVVWN